MSRERVIVEIRSVDQAIKVEETIRTGYCDPIAESLLAWIAVEEDLCDSYELLSAKNSNEESKETLDSLMRESRGNINSLQALLDIVEEFGAARDRRQAMLEKLSKSN